MIQENENVAKIISKNKVRITIKNSQLTTNTVNNIQNEFFHLDKSNKVEKGWYDFFALKIRYINHDLLKENLPDQETSKKFYKILIEIRSLCIGIDEFIGCKKNIFPVIKKIQKAIFKESNHGEIIFFEYFFSCFQSNKLKDEKFVKKFPQITIDKINMLIESIKNENLFYPIAKKLSLLIKSDDETQNNQNNISKESNQNIKPKVNEKKKIPAKTQKKRTSKIREIENYNKSIKESLLDKKKDYKIFTKEFDVSKNAKNLVDFSELNELRKKFDEECKDYTKLVNELVKKLKKLLLAIDTTTWKFSQDEGNFDGSRFAAFIANNNNSSIYKLEKKNIEKNTVVSLLMDNSGSMRGKPIITSALTAEILTQTLEKCNVNVEILGFTTKEWKGGKSKKEWEKSNRPENPGRLNDLLHIVYKDADVSWNFAKKNLGLILKEGLLKENIDGEALIWASNRLKKRSEKKKILIVISDGAPVDDSTLSVNNPNILENHLKEIVTEIEQENKINLVAIGIGHDVSKYYKKAFTIDNPEMLGDVIIENLAENLKD